MALAMSKLDTVNRILSKSLVDGKITDAEFQSVLNEREGYRIQKEIFRKGTLPKENIKQSSPDIDKIREEIKKEEKIKLQKKLLGSAADISK